MIGNNLTWRSASLASEAVVAPQVTKAGDPDNGRSGLNCGAAFEAHILEVAGARDERQSHWFKIIGNKHIRRTRQPADHFG